MPRTAEQDRTTRRQGPQKALTPTTTRVGADGFERTALVIAGEGDSQSGSFDLVDDKGVLLARVNVFLYRDASGAARRVIVDTIDADDTFAEHSAVTFLKGGRKFTKTGTLVSADFSSEAPARPLEATPPPLNESSVRARNVKVGDLLRVGTDTYCVVSLAVLKDPERIMLRGKSQRDRLTELSLSFADDERVTVLR